MLPDFSLELQQVLAQQTEPAVKMTPTQKRNELYRLVTEALKNYDPEALKEALDKYPKSPLEYFTNDLLQTMCKHFEPTSFSMLLDRGIGSKTKMPYTSLLDYIENKEAMVYLLQLPAAELPPHAPAGSTKVFPYSQQVFESYGRLMSSKENAKADLGKRKLHLEMAQAIEEKFPTIFKDTFSNATMVENFFKTSLPVYQRRKADFMRLPDTDWSEVFDNLNKHSFFDTIEPRAFFHFVSFLQEKNLTSEWQNFVQSFEEKKKDVLAFEQQWYGTDWEKSPLRQYLKDRQINTNHWGEKTENFLTKIEADFTNPHRQHNRMNRLKSLNEMDMAKLALRNSYYINAKMSPAWDLPKEMFESTYALSPYDRMIQRGGEMLLVLSKTKMGQNWINESLQWGAVVENFARHTDATTLGLLYKEMPHLKAWRDQDGNSLGHYLAAIRGENARTVAETFMRIDRDAFAQNNALGLSVLDIFDKNGLDAAGRSIIENALMKKELRADGEAGKKLRSRTKFEAPKRKM